MADEQEDNITMEDELNLALSNAKRTQREIRVIVQDIARVRDRYLEEKEATE